MTRIFVFLLMTVLMFSCKNDGATTSTSNDPEVKKIEALKKETNARIAKNQVDGQNDHTHSEKPEAIENNSRVRVPVEKIKKQSPPSYTTPSENPVKSKGEMQAEYKKGMQSSRITLPQPCSLLTDKFIANVVGVPHPLRRTTRQSDAGSRSQKASDPRWCS